MKPNEMNEDMIRDLKKCKSVEDINKFIADNMIELTPEQMEEVSGGNTCPEKDFYDYEGSCPKSESGNCDFEYTGKKRPGSIFGDIWPNYEMKCKYCGQTMWNIWGF